MEVQQQALYTIPASCDHGLNFLWKYNETKKSVQYEALVVNAAIICINTWRSLKLLAKIPFNVKPLS